MTIREVERRKKWEAWEGGRVVLTLVRDNHEDRGAIWSFMCRGFDMATLDQDQAYAALALLQAALE